MARHSRTRPDMRIIAAFVGAHQARTDIAAVRRVVQRTQRAVADLELLDQSKDARPRHWHTEQANNCQQPGCHKPAGWFVQFRRGTRSRPAYRRLCTRDAARRIRRRAHTKTTRRDHTR
jgi:hypothetical protein